MRVNAGAYYSTADHGHQERHDKNTDHHQDHQRLSTHRLLGSAREPFQGLIAALEHLDVDTAVHAYGLVELHVLADVGAPWSDNGLDERPA